MYISLSKNNAFACMLANFCGKNVNYVDNKIQAIIIIYLEIFKSRQKLWNLVIFYFFTFQN